MLRFCEDMAVNLRVAFEDFAESVKQNCKTKHAYAWKTHNGAWFTAISDDKSLIVRALAEAPYDESVGKLVKAGLTVESGFLSADGASVPDMAGPMFIAGVAYVSAEASPGVWLDAYPAAPTEMQVLRAMHEEFRQTGELGDVSFEEFVRLAKPTVAIMSPGDAQHFALAKTEADSG